MVERGSTMPDQELIASLINTYRDLNMTFRPLPEAQLAQRGANGESVRDLMTRLRDHELQFSQQLKLRVSGVPMTETEANDQPVVGNEDPDDTTAMIIAQFGTARESTLAMLHGLPDAEWDTTRDGAASIRAAVRELIATDRQVLDRMRSLVGAR
jgi:hypothetical protein